MNTSMYDAQQGSTSGAHIDMSTASGTNNIHGSALRPPRHELAQRRSLFLQRGSEYSRPTKRIPALHRYTAGGTVGLPIKKDKLFFFVSYQHTHARRRGDRHLPTHGARRDSPTTGRPAGLAAVANNNNPSADPWSCRDSTRSDSDVRHRALAKSIRSLTHCSITSCPNGTIPAILIPSANPNAL